MADSAGAGGISAGGKAAAKAAVTVEVPLAAQAVLAVAQVVYSQLLVAVA